MEKKYELPEDNPEHPEVNEPVVEYNYRREADMVCSPPLTDEELQEALTTEQVKVHLHDHIHKLFNQ